MCCAVLTIMIHDYNENSEFSRRVEDRLSAHKITYRFSMGTIRLLYELFKHKRRKIHFLKFPTGNDLYIFLSQREERKQILYIYAYFCRIYLYTHCSAAHSSARLSSQQAYTLSFSFRCIHKL